LCIICVNGNRRDVDLSFAVSLKVDKWLFSVHGSRYTFNLADLIFLTLVHYQIFKITLQFWLSVETGIIQVFCYTFTWSTVGPRRRWDGLQYSTHLHQ